MEQDDGRWLSGGYTRSIHKCNTPIPGFYGIQLHSLWQCNELISYLDLVGHFFTPSTRELGIH